MVPLGLFDDQDTRLYVGNSKLLLSTKREKQNHLSHHHTKRRIEWQWYHLINPKHTLLYNTQNDPVYVLSGNVWLPCWSSLVDRTG
jgi:hypothetical protein